MIASDPATNHSGTSDTTARAVDKSRHSQKVFDWLFGYDYFIAHRSADGKAYASALYDVLTTKGNELDCFLDVKQYAAGGGLTNMQARALRKTTRLIVIVTPHAHDADAPYLRGEVAEFRRIHPDGIIVPIGSWETLTEKHYPNSQLLPLLPHLPDDICIVESAEQFGESGPSPETVKKLLNDFSEERRSTKRLRWIRRAAILLFILLAIAVWQGISAELQRKKAVKQEAKAKATSVQADFGLALMYREKSDAVDPRVLAHLARALRTDQSAWFPRHYLVSTLRDRCWLLPETEPLHHGDVVKAACFSHDQRRVVTASADGSARVWDAQNGHPITDPMLHTQPVLAAAFSSDDLRVMSVSGGDGALWTWDASNGQQLSKRMLNAAGVFSASFSADGKKVLTGSIDYTARLFAVENAQPLTKTPLRHVGPVDVVAISPDDYRVLTASWGRTARLWILSDEQYLETKYEAEVTSASFSPNGERIVLGLADGTTWLWNLVTAQLTAQPIHHAGAIHAVSFSPDGQRVLTGSADGTARLWNVENGEALGEPIRHEGNVVGVSFSGNGDRAVTASSDKTARIWNLETATPIRGVIPAEFDSQNAIMMALALPMQWRRKAAVGLASFSGDKRRVAIMSVNHTARVWDLENNLPLSQVIHPPAQIGSVSLSPNGSRLVTVLADNTAQTWDVQSSRPVGAPMRHDGEIVSIEFSPDGRRVVTASRDGSVRVWDVESGEAMRTHTCKEAEPVGASLSRDGHRILIAAGTTASIWDADRGEALGEPMRHASRLVLARFSPDGERVFTATTDKTARLWNAHTSQAMGEVMRHDGEVVGVRFSDDSQRILTASANMARVWDAQTGKPLTEPMLHEAIVWAADFSADSAYVATASADKTARVWNAHTGQPLSEPLRHEAEVLVAAFTGDGRCVVTACSNRTARVWDIAVGPQSESPPWLSELAEAVAGRRLDDNDLLVPSNTSTVELREELLALKGDHFWSRFGRWFFMRGPQRTISPDSRITVGELEHLRSAVTTEASANN